MNEICLLTTIQQNNLFKVIGNFYFDSCAVCYKELYLNVDLSEPHLINLVVYDTTRDRCGSLIMWKSRKRSEYYTFEFRTIISIKIYTLTFISALPLMLWSRKSFCLQTGLTVLCLSCRSDFELRESSLYRSRV